MKILFRSRDEKTISDFVRSEWEWSPKNALQENHWGSLLLSEFGLDLPYEVLRKRIHPTILGYALKIRGDRETEISQYVEDIDLALKKITRSPSPIPADFPEVEIEIPEKKRDDLNHAVRLRLSTKSYTSESISFISRDFSWGGQSDEADSLNESMEKRREFFEGGLQQELWQIVNETRQKQNESENSWFIDRFYEDEFDNIIQSHPDHVDSWIDLSDSNSSYLEHPVVLAGSFYTSLCSALLSRLPLKGLELLQRINEISGVTSEVDFDTGINRLDLALFRADPKEALVVEAWQVKLERCLSDYELLQITFAAQKGRGSDWLESYVDKRINSESPLGFLRSLTILGFFNSAESLSKLESLLLSQPDTWRKRAVEEAYSRCQQNIFAQYWFNRFLQHEELTEAWASFRLFLRCVDSRFWLWKDSSIVKQSGRKQIEQRMAFFHNNRDTIRNRVQENESKLKETLYGVKKQEKGIWPWV